MEMRAGLASAQRATVHMAVAVVVRLRRREIGKDIEFRQRLSSSFVYRHSQQPQLSRIAITSHMRVNRAVCNISKCSGFTHLSR